MAINYYERPEMPGKRFFRCERRRADIQVSVCASMWSDGQQRGASERFWICRGCEVGECHAGADNANKSSFYLKPVCLRCLRMTMRMINNLICVSCVNRQYEYLKGRNARGTRPVAHPPLKKHSITYFSGGKAKTISQPHVTGLVELIVLALRDDPNRVRFSAILPPRQGQPDLLWPLELMGG